jgi:transcriptional antiterminator
MENFHAHDYTVIKVFNNNVLLVNSGNKEKILYSKGIGFGKKISDRISASIKIDKIYSIEDASNSDKFNQLMSFVDNDIIGLCEEIIYMISRELNEELNEKIHISLTDHIAFAIKRIKAKDEIINPFLIETETLYRSEFEIARKAINMLERKIGISIPDGEVGFITLHIHSARQQGKLSNTLKYTYLSNSIVQYIEKAFNLTIDRHTIDYARFITHLRFTIERIMNKNTIKNELLNVIKKQYSKSYKIANDVCKLIEQELKEEIVEDEVGYMAVHIEKIRNL